VLGSTRQTIAESWLAFLEHEADTANRVNQSAVAIDVNFLPEPCDLDVNHVVNGSGTARLFPDLAGEHLTGNDMPLMSEEVLEQLELAGRQIKQLAPSRRAAGHEIELEIANLEA
jgi:hypothetical protein